MLLIKHVKIMEYIWKCWFCCVYMYTNTYVHVNKYVNCVCLGLMLRVMQMRICKTSNQPVKTGSYRYCENYLFQYTTVLRAAFW